MARYMRVTALKDTTAPYTVGKEYECLPLDLPPIFDEQFNIVDDDGDIVPIFLDDPEIEWEYLPS